MQEEIAVELSSAGFVEGYPFVGGPGRAIFDAATRAFLRLEPLGGTPAAAPAPAAVQPPEQLIQTDTSTTTVVQGG